MNYRSILVTMTLLIAMPVMAIVLVPYFIINQYHNYTVTSEKVGLTDIKDMPNTAIVLGSGAKPDGTPGEVLASRLDTGLDLFKRGFIKEIILSGYNPGDSYNEPLVMKNYLMAAGIPSKALITDDGGHDTLGSCQSAVDKLEIDRAILITQPGHLDRAVYLCRSLGLEAYGVEASVTGSQGAILFQSVREAGSNIKAVAEISMLGLGVSF